LYASLVGVRATLGGLRDPDTVVEVEMSRRIAAHLAAQATGETIG
jgi:hypothetical protein